jgi:glycosyltransferase involved in cell wall biosynthesis
MIDMPLVSIIIPFLNAERFIKEAIESVFAQTYDNWELFLVDDGSTDASTVIARGYAQQNPEKVRYLEHLGHQNQGVSASRNLAVGHAKGKYITTLDADDVWLPQKLQRQVAILQSHPEVAMTYGPGLWWYSWTGDAEDRQRDYTQGLGVQPNTLIKPPTLLPLFLRQETMVPPPCTLLVQRDVIERIGGWEETFRTLYEDQVFYAKVCLEVPVLVDGEPYSKYRQHPDSLCAEMKETGQYPLARLTYLNWLEKYILQKQVRNEEVWKALRQELWPYRHPILQRISKHARDRINQVKMLLKVVARRILPVSVHQRLRTRWQRQANSFETQGER